MTGIYKKTLVIDFEFYIVVLYCVFTYDMHVLKDKSTYILTKVYSTILKAKISKPKVATWLILAGALVANYIVDNPLSL